jgi:hypothetical protein
MSAVSTTGFQERYRIQSGINKWFGGWRWVERGTSIRIEVSYSIGTAGDGRADGVFSAAPRTRQPSVLAGACSASEGEQCGLEAGDPIAEVGVRLRGRGVTGIVLRLAAGGETARLALRASVCVCVRGIFRSVA